MTTVFRCRILTVMVIVDRREAVLRWSASGVPRPSLTVRRLLGLAVTGHAGFIDETCVGHRRRRGRLLLSQIVSGDRERVVKYRR